MSTLSHELMHEAPPYCWLLQSDARKLGVHRGNGWCVQLKEQCVLFDSEYKCVHLLPALELNDHDFFAFLAHAEVLFPEYAEDIRDFPKLLLVQHAFRHYGSGYWPEKAMTWLEHDANLQPLLQSDLEELCINMAMPQQLRQRAKRMLRSLSAVEA